MVNILKISLYIVRRDKFKKIIMVIMALVFLLGTILSIYQKGAKNYIDNYDYEEYYLRIIQVGKADGTLTEKKEELESVNHVLDVFKNYDISIVSLQSDELKRSNTDGYIDAYTATNNTLPKIIEGTNFPDNDGYYLVCPNEMYANLTLGDNSMSYKITNKDKIDTSDYLNRTITFTYTAYANQGDTITKTIDVEIIGTYEVSDSIQMENRCYMNEKLKEDTYYGTYEDIDEELYDLSENENSLAIVIDDYDNIDEVLGELEDLGYYTFPLGEVNTDFLSEITITLDYFCEIILIVSFFLIFILFGISLKRSSHSYKLFQYLGYSKAKIGTINLYSDFFVSFFAFLLSLILSIIYKYIAEVIVYFRPFIFNKYEIIFSFNYLIKISLISLIFVFVISLLNNILLNFILERCKIEKR